MKRRQFIQTAIGGSALLVLPISLKAISNIQKENLKFGVCADIHKDIMQYSDFRLKTFIEKASARDLDFIIQLGDFCRPYKYNREFLSIWDKYVGDKYHVIGNHEMDGGFSRKDVIDFWDIPKQYYSIDKNGFHIIVLDGNDKNPSKDKASGYARFIGETQMNWLKADLNSTKLPCIIFSHQTLENNDDGIENRAEIREMFEAENRRAGFNKIIACFSGHHHTDYVAEINDIYYIQINSMSYEWLGEKYKTIRYSTEIDKKYPYIKYTIPYKEPLFAFVEIGDKSIEIEGMKSSFVGLSPKELGCPVRPENKRIVPEITDRDLKFK